MTDSEARTRLKEIRDKFKRGSRDSATQRDLAELRDLEMFFSESPYRQEKIRRAIDLASHYLRGHNTRGEYQTRDQLREEIFEALYKASVWPSS
jgi:hypothetical protein